ncbi:hypothetical protein CapIbe_022501 [Capra ibex]
MVCLLLLGKGLCAPYRCWWGTRPSPGGSSFQPTPEVPQGEGEAAGAGRPLPVTGLSPGATGPNSIVDGKKQRWPLEGAARAAESDLREKHGPPPCGGKRAFPPFRPNGHSSGRARRHSPGRETPSFLWKLTSRLRGRRRWAFAGPPPAPRLPEQSHAGEVKRPVGEGEIVPKRPYLCN